MVVLTVLLLAKQNKQPFKVILQRLRANPNEMDADSIVLLLPSLISSSAFIRPEQIAIFEEITLEKYGNIRNEIIESAKLRK